MAIVLVIVSTLLGGLLISLSQTQEMNNRRNAEAKLDDIVEALYGYAQATGRLPCPATPTSNGAEVPVGGGACTEEHGLVPSATLGLSGALDINGLLMDKWLGAYRYSVSDSNGDAFTTSNGIRGVGIAAMAPTFRVCDAAACGTVIADAVPVVIMSLGADWVDFTGADVDETENSGERTLNGYRLPNDDDFVQSAYIEDTFDDLVTWISPGILFTRMIAAGQLP